MEGQAADLAQSNGSMASLNPWVLHLQKLGLELKCPLCLGFFDRPILLLCNHIVCKDCLTSSTQIPVPCPQCQTFSSYRDLRPAPYIENMVAIYKRMDATIHAGPARNAAIRAVRGPDWMAAANGENVQEEVKVTQGHGEGKEPYRPAGEITTSGVFGNSNSSCAHLTAEERVVGRAILVDMNPAMNSSPGSPPLSDSRSLDDDSSVQGSDQTGRYLRACKRQKKVNNCESGTATGVDNCISSKAGSEQGLHSRASQSAFDTTKSCPNSFPCAFCSSSAISVATGEMLHYLKGYPVEDDEVANRNVTHVHRKCIEWAPQVYFDGERVINLEKELARGSKLKCGRCGHKGAALGCYVRSCRMTYHAPCAVEVSACRWDCDNYLMLCPSHASMKFPNEKSKLHSSKLASSEPPKKASSSQLSEFWQDRSNKAKSWVLCGSSLYPEDKLLLVKFATMIGASVSKVWSPEVTHVVAATDEEGACTRSFKVLMAILHGRWILKIDWIKACMEAMRPVDEESYEIGLDNHGSSNGPKLGRLRILNTAPKLFDKLKFYLAGDFIPAFARDLRSLITAGGGEVVKSKESLTAASDDKEASTRLIVFNPEPPEGVMLGEEVSIYWQKINEADDLAASSGSKVVTHTWVLESISASQLQPFVDLSGHLAA